MRMKKPKDEKVQRFLEEIMLVNGEQYEILHGLRAIVFQRYPSTEERMMYGGIMFSLGEDYGGIFVRKNHVSFEFSLGVKMDDPESMLEGTGKMRRHLKIRSTQDIEDKNVDFFVGQVLT